MLTVPDDEVCGVPVTTTVDIIENILVRLAKSGFPLFQTTGPGTITFTNPDIGKSISGPHPDLESDGELFCEVVVPARSWE